MKSIPIVRASAWVAVGWLGFGAFAAQAQAPTFDDEFNGLDVSGRGTWQPNLSWVNPDGKNGDSNDQATFKVNPNYAPLAAANPFSVTNGALDIVIKPTPAGINPADVNYKPYVTGLLQTAGKFSQLYGYFEMRAKMPAGNGVGGAFWLLPTDGSWPPEIDIMESLGQDVTTVYQTLHNGTDQNNTILQVYAQVPGGNFSNSFHTYGVDWESDYTTFYVDGKQTGRYATPANMHKPMFMVLNDNASNANNNWGNPIDSSTPIPAHFYVDYVRVYASLPDLSSGGSPSPTGGGTPPTSSAALVSGATYKLTARHSRLALDVAGNSLADEARVIQWPWNGGPNQQWVVDRQADGSYTLTHQGTTKRLDVKWSGTQDGDVVWQYAANDNSDAQRWLIAPTDSGYYKLLHKGTTKCLDVAGGSAAQGTPVQQWEYHGYRNQQWKFERLGGAANAGARTLAAPDQGGRELEAVRLYPNPAQGQVFVRLATQPGEQVQLEVRDALARRVAGAAHVGTGGPAEMRLPLAGLPAGVYTLTVQRASGERTVQRLVVAPQ